MLAAAASAAWAWRASAWHRFSHSGPPGVLLGYGNLSEPAIEQGIRLLAEAFAEVGGVKSRAADAVPARR